MNHTNVLSKTDWIRFQIPDGLVLEGFVQEFSENGHAVRIGKSRDSNENQWFRVADLKILKQQTLGAPA